MSDDRVRELIAAEALHAEVGEAVEAERQRILAYIDTHTAPGAGTIDAEGLRAFAEG